MRSILINPRGERPWVTDGRQSPTAVTHLGRHEQRLSLFHAAVLFIVSRAICVGHVTLATASNGLLPAHLLPGAKTVHGAFRTRPARQVLLLNVVSIGR